MEEEVGARVTRLRRRLSVEQSDESKSPAPPTPTKKRGTRAAKPQLELIEEIVTVAEKVTPRRATRRSFARDTVEEEKPLTPSRRSTRIRSNTSLVSESTQNIDSPRAKRATRRTSQVGSDNEAPTATTTPARTRKTRKDSATVEKAGDTTIITDVISEEPEINNFQSKTLQSPETSNDSNKSPNSLRKSTRLSAKKSPGNFSKLNESLDNDNRIENNNTNNNFSASKKAKDRKSTPDKDEQSILIKSNESKENDLSLTSRNLIDSIETKSPKTSSTLNNSAALIKNTSHTQSKRNRTKSWTTISASSSKETDFFSDNEGAKQKIKQKLNSGKGTTEGIILNESGGGGDSVLNNSKNKRCNSLISKPQNESVTEKIDTILEKSEKESNEIKELFKKSPALVQTKVFIEDSDSNAEVDQLVGDQCVPFVKDVFVNDTPGLVTGPASNEDQVDSTMKAKINQSVEPMDIDETMPDNVVLNDSDQLNSSIDSTSTKSKKKFSISNRGADNTSFNESRKKSSVSMDSKIINESKRKSFDVNNPMEVSNVSFNNEHVSKRKSSDSLKEYTFNERPADKKSLNVTNSPIAHNKSTNGENTKRKSALSESNSENVDGKNIATSELEYVTNNNARDPDAGDKSKLGNKNKTINSSKTKSPSKSLTGNTTMELNESFNHSNRKASISQVNLEESVKSTIESKSTLILSQIKDGSDTPVPSKKEKSLNVTVEEGNGKKLNNKNLTKISTSTPLLDKTVSKAKKRGSVDISDITLKENTNTSIKSKCKNISDLMSSDGSGASSDDDESSEGSSKLVIDEAEGISDDYESGDSQDDEERQYEKENEIIERGETLTSDEDISNDSDYEKDSFIVSSDEEDNELLDGSGDDLALSDNELSMSAKSKKKYNERKIAEQKQASREMFNSRHKINSSKNTSKSKSKSKIDSLLLESDDDVEKSKSKKSNRLRLDSSHETSAMNADESIIAKKTKAKRLSESLIENAADENEITLYADNTEDPLIINIKEEPKSARQSLNINTTHNCIENVQVDENATISNTNDSNDPLQATVAENDDSDISDNEEITNNYDNLLNSLNKKTANTSLNISKKSKKTKEPIIDELNLTLTKKSNLKEDETETKLKICQVHQDDSSSDSIDMKLLFNEDSNDIEDRNNDEEKEGDFIPLKRTEAKTDLLKETRDVKNKRIKKLSTSGMEEPSNEKLNKSLNVSLNVIVKRNQQNLSIEQVRTPDNEKSQINKSLNRSIKCKNISIVEDANEKEKNTSVVASEKKKKRNKSFTEENVELESSQMNNSLNKSMKNRKVSILEDASEKQNSTSIVVSGKKKKHNKSNSEQPVETSELETSKMNKSLDTSMKNKKVSLSEDASEEQSSASIVVSGKKKKHNKSNSEQPVETSELETSQMNKSLDTSMKNKKVSLSEDASEEQSSASIVVSGKKKKHNKSNSEQPVETSELETSQMNKSLDTSMKNKKVSLSEDASEEQNSASIVVSGKKKKHNKSISEQPVETSELETSQMNKSLDTSMKNKKVSLSEDASEEQNSASIVVSGKKKKHNKSISEEPVETSQSETSQLDKSLNTSMKNRKVSLFEDATDKEQNSIVASGKKKKHNKSISEEPVETSQLETSQLNTSLNTSMKYRKVSISEFANYKEQNTSIVASGKKKCQKSITEDQAEVSQLETSIKNRKVSVSEDSSEKDNNTSVVASGKKKRNESITVNQIEPSQSGDNDDMPQEIPYKSEKNNDVDTENHKTTEETESGKKKKKRNKKRAHQESVDIEKPVTKVENMLPDQKQELQADEGNIEESKSKTSKKRKRNITAENTKQKEGNPIVYVNEQLSSHKNKKQKLSETPEKPVQVQTQKKNKKRKNREDDIASEENNTSPDKGIPRLPADIINQLAEKPKKERTKAKKAKLVATSDFEVLERRKTKEFKSQDIETVFLNGETSKQKKLLNKNKSKFVPFEPVLATSKFGFTTNFQVSVIPKETKFVAVSTPAEISNFKRDYLSKKLKKMATDHMCRNPRSARLSKF